MAPSASFMAQKRRNAIAFKLTSRLWGLLVKAMRQFTQSVKVVTCIKHPCRLDSDQLKMPLADPCRKSLQVQGYAYQGARSQGWVRHVAGDDTGVPTSVSVM